jgi:hypothetical protein
MTGKKLNIHLWFGGIYLTFQKRDNENIFTYKLITTLAFSGENPATA